jgi:carbonic anhydrase
VRCSSVDADVTQVRAAREAEVSEVRRLFREYAAWVGVDLSFQGFEQEVEGLPGDYVAPAGVLLVAEVDGEVAGCVAGHRWSTGVCEMKRLFVREAFRGAGCGRALVESIVAWARGTGYARILLDTLPGMDRAQRPYTELGFREVAPYRFDPVRGARFLELVLE